jgi:hypothetical protein
MVRCRPVGADPLFVDYPLLARALLERGEQPRSVISFLCSDYGLEEDQAKAAIILAQKLPEELVAATRDRPSGRGRSRLRRHGVKLVD